jgi:phosphatidylglycerophosphatase A
MNWPFLSLLWARLLPDAWVHGLATVWGAGNVPKAPGTVGAAIGVVWYVTVFVTAPTWLYWALLVISLFAAAGICGESAARLGKKDPGEVILDEVVVMPLCFMGFDSWYDRGHAWWILLLGFALFRLFDITKPGLIGRMDRMEGGWGILLDDVAAALATCAVMHLILSTGWIERFIVF